MAGVPLSGLAVFVTWLGLTHGAHFFLTAPSELHYDVDYVVTVTATGIQGRGDAETVHLEYRSHNMMTPLPINSTTLIFGENGVKTWAVSFRWMRMQLLGETMLDLYMITNQDRVENEVHKTLTFSRRSGHIFIQTDKPLYTPRQTVKFRVLAVDEDQRLAKYPLKVDVLNDQKIVVDRMRYSAEEAFRKQEFELPKEGSTGIWSISAEYEGLDHSYSAKQTVYFEVREYVLPQFSSSLSISEDVITKSTHWITITINSTYIHGRPVLGQVEMRLGVWSKDAGVEFLDFHLLEWLEEGQLTKDIPIAKILPRGREFQQSRRLYVSVNVTEAGTLENDTIVDTSTFIAHPYYELNYNMSKTTFKPGFPYIFKMQARAKSSRPSSWMKVYVTVYSIVKDGDSILKKFLTATMSELNGNGEMQWPIDTPADADKLLFKTLVLDLKQDYLLYDHEVPKAQSRNDQYLHVSLEEPVTKTTDGEILLRYTKATRSSVGSFITVMVMAKGHVLHSTKVVRNSDGRSTVGIPNTYYWDLTPAMRIVAFYYMDGETVTDSLAVDTEDICISELSLHPMGGLFGRSAIVEPKDPYTLEVYGGPFMKVGLVAVDTAVFLLNDKKTLTRESMFRQLGSHDPGTMNGDGENREEVFKNSGLLYMELDSDRREPLTMEGEPGLGRVIINKKPQTPSGGLFDFQQGIDLDADGGPKLADAPPHTVRKYFPESWLFDEFTVPGSGLLYVNTTMPDSLTTWSFLAVGISAMRGVCVSTPHRETVEKLFFVNVRMPYKVKRLEVVKVRIAVYNFREDKVELFGQISGNGVCFPTERKHDWNNNGTDFTMTVDRRSTKGVVIKMIPLRNGELTIRVDVAVKNDPTRDVVERKLYVEAEGLRVKKSITFVLDPEAKRSRFRRIKDNKIILSNTTTVSNLIDLRNKKQETKIDLALPKKVIRGTERCRIAAFGDLMGDIINHAVVQSRSLLEQPVLDAEEVLGDLGPTVHALLYTEQRQLLGDTIALKGRRFVKHAVARLLSYRKDNAFSLRPDSKPATWLTAFVLKTLCHAMDLAFIQKENVIDKGFIWLLEQLNEDGSLNEQDWRLANDSLEYRLMLSADVLIALTECASPDIEKDHWLELEANVAFFLEENLDSVTHPMILAKAAYALNKFDPASEPAEKAVNRLLASKRRTSLGHTYWSSKCLPSPARNVPFWYHQGAQASSIEGTAFALMLFLERSGTNVDAIADWLVAQRNEKGAFIGAMDSTAAIQALAMYSRQKHSINVDLLCNVTSFQLKEYKHSFKFTQKNAMREETVNNVPVSQVLHVATTGQGLGQMQVNVEYNIPIDKNKFCPFKVRVQLKQAKATMFNLNKGPLCLSCGIGCPKEEVELTRRLATMADTFNIDQTSSVKVHINPKRLTKAQRRRNRLKQQRNKRKKARKNRKANKRAKTRKPREAPTFNIRQHPAASKKVVCFHICLQHLEDYPSGPTTVDIEMLSGYNPVETDWKKIQDTPDVKGVEYLEDSAILRIHFFKVAHGNETCLGFRAKDDMEVGRPAPATVLIHQEGIPVPVCALEYKAPQETASLQVYCADIGNNNRGECRCYSGLCASCRPYRMEKTSLGIADLREHTCNSGVAYHVEMLRWKDENQWFEIEAQVKSINKTGSHEISEGDIITMQTPSSCYCPVGEYKMLADGQAKFYLLSPDVERLTDHNGDAQYRYLIDHRSSILRVSDPNQTGNNSSQLPTIKHEFLKAAMSQC